MAAPWTPLGSTTRYQRGKLTLREDTWRGQYRHLPREVSWELPGGGALPGEEPIAAAQRELREEGGYRAAELTFLTRFLPSSAYLDEVAYCYVGRGLTPDPLPADDDEFIERRVVPVTEAVRMALEDEITESVSKLTLLAWAARAR